MNLEAKKVKFNLNEYQRIRTIYKDAFSKIERMSFWKLMFLRRPKFVNFLAFYDQDTFCGITYFLIYKNTIFLQYLVVDPNVRSQGYGTKIINWIKAAYPLHNICLYIDEPDKKYVDYDVRFRRLHFYERNGFKMTNYIYICKGFALQILIYGSELKLNRFREAYWFFSYATYYPKIIEKSLVIDKKKD